MNVGCERYQGVYLRMRRTIRENNTSRTNDAGISEMVSSTLIIVLVVVLAGVIAAFVLGYIPVLQKPTMTAFSVSAVTDSSLQTVAISLVPVVGDPLSASSGATQAQGGKAITNMTINLIDPSGLTKTVTLCASMPASTKFKPGDTLYIFKRNQPNYYIANSTSAPACGGGGGGGSPTNQPFTVHGNWRIIIADTMNSNTVVYDGTVRL
jgi:FlaG/FlaF family flagellin (archaellin)